jgi:sigma-E factor negative regulatory protein RseC
VGIVIATSDGVADVSTWRRGACAGCSESASCGIDMQEECPEVVTAENRVGAWPGDTVELALPDHAALELSLLVWVLPLVGLVVGAFAGTGLADRIGLGADAAGALGALAGLVVAFTGLRQVDRRAAGSPRITPRITRVLHRAGPEAAR